MSRARRASRERGAALIVVLLGLGLLLTVVGELARAMRLEATTTANFRSARAATHLAEAGYHLAAAEILPQALAHHFDPAGALVFRRQRLAAPDPPRREGLALGAGRLSYRITDEGGRINLNRAAPDVLHRLLTELGVEKADRDVIVDSIQDWRDPNEEYRLNGAESEYYLGLPTPYRAKNADFDTVDELRLVRGVTPRLLDGGGGAPGLAEYLTVASTGVLNVNTADPVVLRALGFAQAEAELLVKGRPYLDLNAVPGPLRRGAQRVRSDTFRIEAWGEVDGRRGARLVAVVREAAGQEGRRVVPLAWGWTAGPPEPAAPERP